MLGDGGDGGDLSVCAGLKMGAEYRIRLSAVNVNGSGPDTAWMMATTRTTDLDGQCGGGGESFNRFVFRIVRLFFSLS